MEPITVMLGIIALIQIITESLPISSTLHVKVATWVVNFFTSMGNVRVDVVALTGFEHFMHALHLPTAIICLFLFFFVWYKKITGFSFAITDLVAGNWIIPSIKPLCIVAGSSGIVLAAKVAFDAASRWFHMTAVLPHDPSLHILLFWSLLTGLLYALQYELRVHKVRKPYTWEWSHILIIGCASSVALMLPGVSRLGVIMLVLSWLDVRFEDLVPVAFLYAFPLFISAGIVGLVSLVQYPVFFSWFVCKNMIIGTIIGFRALQFLSYSVSRRQSVSSVIAYVRKIWLIVALYLLV